MTYENRLIGYEHDKQKWKLEHPSASDREYEQAIIRIVEKWDI